MMTKTIDLTGPALDWAAAQVAGSGAKLLFCLGHRFQPSTDWAQGGPIIERERIAVKANGYGWWFARVGGDFGQGEWVRGDTPLIAAMRGYVASKLGDEIDVPDKLI